MRAMLPYDRNLLYAIALEIALMLRRVTHGPHVEAVRLAF